MLGIQLVWPAGIKHNLSALIPNVSRMEFSHTDVATVSWRWQVRLYNVVKYKYLQTLLLTPQLRSWLPIGWGVPAASRIFELQCELVQTSRQSSVPAPGNWNQFGSNMNNFFLMLRLFAKILTGTCTLLVSTVYKGVKYKRMQQPWGRRIKTLGLALTASAPRKQIGWRYFSHTRLPVYFWGLKWILPPPYKTLDQRAPCTSCGNRVFVDMMSLRCSPPWARLDARSPARV